MERLGKEYEQDLENRLAGLQNRIHRGVAKEEGLAPRQFELLLDRSGVDLEAITEAVKKAKNSVEDLDDKPPYLESAMA